MSDQQRHKRKMSLKERTQSARERMNKWKEDVEGETPDVMAEVENDPVPDKVEEDCFGMLAAPGHVRARAVALTKYNQGEGEEAARQYDSYFNFATLLLGFEGFILSDYLKNDPSGGNFPSRLNWSVACIMWSFIVNVFLAVVTLHMSKTTAAASFEPWHRAFMPLAQWGCRASVILFTIGINLLVAECSAFGEPFKFSIYALTGLFFLWVVGIYISVWFGPTDRIIDYFVPRNTCGECCCSFLTGQTPTELDLLEIHAATIRDEVEREMRIEAARIKRWRLKKKEAIANSDWKEGVKKVGMQTLRHAKAPFLEEEALHMEDYDDDVEKGKEKELEDMGSA